MRKANLHLPIWVWKDFYYYKGGIYKHKWGRLVGGHLITLVGYDDLQRCWICKNSWGENWGENGWVRISYDEDIFIPHCYGGTGILYIDGVYGNLMPDVPKVYIEEPKRWHTYIFGREMPSIFGRALVQVGIPRVIGAMPIRLNVSNAIKVEFYLDGKLQYIDDKEPFEWMISCKPGLHTIEVMAYNERNASKAIVDILCL